MRLLNVCLFIIVLNSFAYGDDAGPKFHTLRMSRHFPSEARKRDAPVFDWTMGGGLIPMSEYPVPAGDSDLAYL
jgi:hypothetical protein